jgi:ABC-2 type transport system permease protein
MHAAGHRPRLRHAWAVVAEQELRDAWLGGRALALIVLFSAFLSVVLYLLATNTALNLLEQREAVTLMSQLGVAVGAILALILAADAVSGERERSTLEALLVSPAPRRAIVFGKLLAALSLWAAAFVVVIPYLWFLGHGIGIAGEAAAATLFVGTMLAVALAGLGMTVSAATDSNRASLSISLLALLALVAPTQLPPAAQSGWAGNVLFRLNPVTAGEHYLGRLLTDGHPWWQDISWLLSPAIAAGVLLAVTAVSAESLGLRGWRH